MGQPLATCCNSNQTNIISDLELQPLPQEIITSTKNRIDIAQLIKKRQEPLAETLSIARKHRGSATQYTSEQTQTTWSIQVPTENNQINWIVCRGNKSNKDLDGEMTIYFPNGELFEGKIVNNQPTNGIYIFKKGCFYIGDISEFNAEGNGRYENIDTSYIYQGTFSKSLPHGKGKQSYKNGDSYEGQIMYGQKFGMGVYRFSNGNIYIGCFYYNQSDGKGKIVYADASYYEGEWKLGKFNGFGKFVWANGEVYEGQYLEGLKHGKGKFTFKNNGWYEGEWQNGLQSGKGKYCEGYDSIEGTWQEGEFIG